MSERKYPSERFTGHVTLQTRRKSGLTGPTAACPTTSQCRQWAVGSTGGRNTLIFRKRWSVQNEVSPPHLLFIQTARWNLGSLSAMRASPASNGWQCRESMSSIGRVYEQQSSSVFSVIAPGWHSPCRSETEHESVGPVQLTFRSPNSFMQTLVQRPSTA